MKQVVIHAWNTHTCTCTRKSGELPVRGDLAYTPAQMYEAAKAGVPISAQYMSPKQHEHDAPRYDYQHRQH